MVNMNELFDKLQEYIDQKITGIESGLEEMFIEYGLKEIQPYYDEIQIGSNNIDAVARVAIDIQSVNTVATNIDEILLAPDHIDEMKAIRTDVQVLHDSTVEYNENAYDWSTAPQGQEVNDGTHTGYSSFHWSKVAENVVAGFIFMGLWSPLDGAFPVASEHGEYWLVNESGYFENVFYAVNDKLIWSTNDVPTGEFIHYQNVTEWVSIINEPEFYKPEQHEHDTQYFDQVHFRDISTGITDGGKPVKLAGDGLIHNSMIKLPVLFLVGSFTPSTILEYPDVSNYESGASWMVSDLVGYYMFTSGDLIDIIVTNGDFLIWSEEGWLFKDYKLTPEEYLRRDGSAPMYGPLGMGGHKIIDVGPGDAPGEVVTYEQITALDEDYFKKTDFVFESTGSNQQYAPVALNAYGLLDVSMMGLNNLIFIGDWSPTDLTPYPAATPEDNIGNYWMIAGLPPEGYTFLEGDLLDVTVLNSDYIIMSQSGWVQRSGSLDDPNAFYPRDGTLPMEAPVNCGDNLVSYMADGVLSTDGATVGQMNSGLNGRAEAIHRHVAADIDTVGLDADSVDGLHADDIRQTAEPVPWSELSNIAKAGQTDFGTVRVWAEGEALHIATTNYVAP
jgi:hypothetical protein